MIEEIKEAVAPVMTAFEEFKSANDARLKEIEKKGSADVLFGDKIAKIEKDLDKYEDLNQKLTLAQQNADAIKKLNAEFDTLEAAFNRVPTGGAKAADVERKTLLNNWARAVVGANTVGVLNLPEDQRKALEVINAEHKSLALLPDTAGGYLAPVDYVREIIKAQVLISPVRTVANVRQTAMRSVQLPQRTGVFAAQWVAEQGTKSETTGLTYGLFELPTSELYALVDISNQMLEDAAFDMQAEISSESATQFAVAEGAAFVSGNGVGKPEGFMTNADVSSDVSGSAATIQDANGQANGILTLKHALKTAYAQNAIWVMNRTTLGSVRKLQDSNKRYIWMPGIAQGAPNTIDGDPYVEMPDMPSEGSNTYPIAYGDFKRAYTWVDRLAMEMLRDPYTQATSGNIRFVMRKRVGGKVVLAEAIRKLKCST